MVDILRISKCSSSLELLRLDPLDRWVRRSSCWGAVLRCVLSSGSVWELLLLSERSDLLAQIQAISVLWSKFTGPNCTLQMMCHKSHDRENVSLRDTERACKALRGLQSDWHHSPVNASLFFCLCYKAILYYNFILLLQCGHSDDGEIGCSVSTELKPQSMRMAYFKKMFKNV